jgi:hypothetical protein
MWCPYCQHDQPTPAGDSPAAARCANCGTILDADAPILEEIGERSDDAVVVPTQGDPRIWSTWELSEQLRHVERVLSIAYPHHRTSRDGHQLRIDPPGQPTGPPAAMPAPTRGGRRFVTAVAWMIVAIGIVAFTCGAVLAGMGWNTQRAQLWTIGLPMIVGGQLAIVVGLAVRVIDLGTRLSKTPPAVERDMTLKTMTSRSNAMR